MNTEAIIAALDDEIQKLQQARSLLNGNEVEPNPVRAVRQYTKRAANLNHTSPTSSAPTTAKKTSMSPEARKRIADAMRARWAAKRGTVKAIKSVKK